MSPWMASSCSFLSFNVYFRGGVRFPVDPLILKTLLFYGLCPDQLPPNFYQVVSSVSQLNNLYGLHLDQHDVNYMYSLCGKESSGYYLRVRDTWVWLISCLPTLIEIRLENLFGWATISMPMSSLARPRPKILVGTIMLNLFLLCSALPVHL